MNEFDSIREDELLLEFDEPLIWYSPLYSCRKSADEPTSLPFQHTAAQRSQFQVESYKGQLATTQLDNGCPKDSHDTPPGCQTVFEPSEFTASTKLTHPIYNPYRDNYQFPKDCAVSDTSFECYPASANRILQPPAAEVIPRPMLKKRCFSFPSAQRSQFQVESYKGQLATTQLDNGCPKDSHDTSLGCQTVFEPSEFTDGTKLTHPIYNPYRDNHQFPKDCAVSDTSFECYPASANRTLQPPTAEVTPRPMLKKRCFSFPSDQQQLPRQVPDKDPPPKFKLETEQRADCLYSTEAVPDLLSIPESRAVTASSTYIGEYNQSNFKKPEDTSLSELTLSSYLRAMQSVGALIKNGQLVGTVFRVGSCYVMTAWHCIHSIIYDQFVREKIQFQKLQNTNVFIHFSPSLTTPTGNIFYIQQLCYLNELLDVAVLELCKCSNLQPDPPGSLKLCRNLISVVECPRANIIGFGHPTDQSNLKILDPSCKIISPDDQCVANARRWFHKEKSRLATALLKQAGNMTLGYEGFDRQEKMLFSCFTEHGISGGPVFSHKDPQHIYVIGIVTNGLPHCLWDLNAAHRACIPFDYRFEMGTRMNFICSDIENVFPELAHDIFS